MQDAVNGVENVGFHIQERPLFQQQSVIASSIFVLLVSCIAIATYRVFFLGLQIGFAPYASYLATKELYLLNTAPFFWFLCVAVIVCLGLWFFTVRKLVVSDIHKQSRLFSASFMVSVGICIVAALIHTGYNVYLFFSLYRPTDPELIRFSMMRYGPRIFLIWLVFGIVLGYLFQFWFQWDAKKRMVVGSMFVGMILIGLGIGTVSIGTPQTISLQQKGMSNVFTATVILSAVSRQYLKTGIIPENLSVVAELQGEPKTKQMISQVHYGKVSDTVVEICSDRYLAEYKQDPDWEIIKRNGKECLQVDIVKENEGAIQNVPSPWPTITPLVLDSSSVVYIKEEEAVWGNTDATIGAIVYVDLSDGYSKNYYEELEKIVHLDTSKVAIVFRHFPLIFYPYSNHLAQTAQCILKEKGKEAFLGYIAGVFKGTPVESDAELDAHIDNFAITIGFSKANIQTCLETQQTKTEVESHIQEAKKLRITGTPYTVYYNKITKKSVLLAGARSFEEIVSQIQSLEK